MDAKHTDSITTEDFPLHCLLLLYSAAHSRDVYCDYMAGFKLLAQWLGPIAVPDLPVVEIPKLCGNWEVQQIARKLGCREDVVYQVVSMLYRETPTKGELHEPAKTSGLCISR